MAKSPEEMEAAMIANLAEKTGKTLPQWLKVSVKSGLAKHGELVKMLKADHGMTHGYANLVAHQTLSAGAPAAAGDDAGARARGHPRAHAHHQRHRETMPHPSPRRDASYST